MPQLSIIIPLFNSCDFISRALQSCINQTLKDIEILIIDDKSKDNSLNMVLEFAKKDPRIKIFQNEENLGTFASRNFVGGKIKCRKRKIKCRIFATNYLSFNLKLKL